MKKDTSIIISSIIFSILCYLSDAFGIGVVVLFGVFGISASGFLFIHSSPMENLSGNEETVLSFERKYIVPIMVLFGLNITGFYLAFPYVGGWPDDNRILLSFTTILGFASLIGFFLGLVISIFPYRDMVFINRYKRGTVIGQLIVHGAILAMYFIVGLMFFFRK